MRFVRRLLSRTAIIPIIIIEAANTTMAEAATTPGSGLNVIDAAQRAHNRVFFWYIVVLVCGAVLAAVFSYWVWSSGNKVSDAIRADALARIGEANAKSDQANERSKKLENDNLKLRANILMLERSIGDRSFFDQLGAAREISPFSDVPVTIEYFPDQESKNAAGYILSVFNLAKWRILGFREMVDPKEVFFEGVSVIPGHMMPNSEDVKTFPPEVQRAYAASDLLVGVFNKDGIIANNHPMFLPRLDVPLGSLVILVGKKPNPAIAHALDDFFERTSGAKKP